MMIRINHGLAIDSDELIYRFVRASGPGGQHVNKVSTAVELRFDLAGCTSLPNGVKQRAVRLAGNRLTAAGELILFSDRFRSQALNREDVTSRLVDLLAKAAIAPRPRRATRPGRGANERRLKAKQIRSNVKQGRSRPRGDY